MKLFKVLPLLLIVLLACNPQNQNTQENTDTVPADDEKGMEVTKAVAVVHGLNDRDIEGTVTFEEAEGGVLVKGSIYGLEAGKHGFHIHEYGDCTADDGTSAGGHFNPSGNEHGAPIDADRHMGDMGNLVAVAGEFADIEYVDETINIEQILGRGIIIHGGEDDLESQPSGAAGPRVACGVIGIQH